MSEPPGGQLAYHTHFGIYDSVGLGEILESVLLQVFHVNVKQPIDGWH